MSLKKEYDALIDERDRLEEIIREKDDEILKTGKAMDKIINEQAKEERDREQIEALLVRIESQGVYVAKMNDEVNVLKAKNRRLQDTIDHMETEKLTQMEFHEGLPVMGRTMFDELEKQSFSGKTLQSELAASEAAESTNADDSYQEEVLVGRRRRKSSDAAGRSRSRQDERYMDMSTPNDSTNNEEKEEIKKYVKVLERQVKHNQVKYERARDEYEQRTLFW
jgi:hypothetical protein